MGYVGCLLFNPGSQPGSMLFHRKTKFAFAFQQFNGAQYAFFERLEIVCGHSYLRGMFCECGHLNLIALKRNCFLKKSIVRKFGDSITKHRDELPYIVHL